MHATVSRWLLASACVLASAASAEPASTVAQGVSVGVSSFLQLGLWRNSESASTVDAAYQRALGVEGFGSHVFLGGGLRYAFPSSQVTFPLELYIRGELRTRVDFWEPAAGLEAGYSRVELPRQSVRLPTAIELYEQNDALAGPVYFALHAAPLRFHFGRFVVGGPEVQWGPAGPPFRTGQRLHVGLARLEVQL